MRSRLRAIFIHLQANYRLNAPADQGIFNCLVDVLEGIEGNELLERKAAERMKFDQFGEKFFRVRIPEDDAANRSAAIHDVRSDESELGVFRSASYEAACAPEC